MTSDMRSLLTQLSDTVASLEPPIRAEFATPATLSSIQDAEKRLDVTFPDELREVLLWANGQMRDEIGGMADPIFPRIRFGPGPDDRSGWGWLNRVTDVVESTLWFRDFVKESLGGQPPERYESQGPASFHSQYVLFSTATDPMGLYIDLRPENGGHLFQVVGIDGDLNKVVVLAPSLREYFKLVLSGFKGGRFVYGGGVWSEP